MTSKNCGRIIPASCLAACVLETLGGPKPCVCSPARGLCCQSYRVGQGKGMVGVVFPSLGLHGEISGGKKVLGAGLFARRLSDRH